MPRSGFLLAASLGLAFLPRPLAAQTSTSRDIALGGYLQTQYERTADPVDEPRDRVMFRRLLVWVSASLDDNWSGEFQIDFAPVTLGDRVLIKDAYLRYSGWDSRGLVITLGNQKMPFSRSSLTSASQRGLVERPLTGDRAFGAPGRSLGMRIDGHHRARTVQWSAAVASTLHEPDAEQIRLDGLPAAGADWNEGILVGGRAEWHPLGNVPMEQGAFDIQHVVVTIAAATYFWRNDGDNNPNTANGLTRSDTAADLQSSVGLEVSGGIRAPRLSVDAEFHRITGDTVDRSVTLGFYRSGRARLLKTAVEAGYMLLPRHFEILGALDALDVKGRNGLAWRPAVGMNWYVKGHRLKFQFMHRETFNALSIESARARETFAQAQIVF